MFSIPSFEDKNREVLYEPGLIQLPINGVHRVEYGIDHQIDYISI